MARKLKHLSEPIGNYGKRRFKQRIALTDGDLPAVLKPAYLARCRQNDYNSTHQNT